MNSLRYFSSFEGYGEPIVPVGELPFAETISAPTYYRGRFNATGELLQFRKIVVTRRESRSFVLSERTKPDTTVFFKVVDRSDAPIAWNPITFPATEGLTEYYEGLVDSTGLGGNANRFERLVAFSVNYGSRTPHLGHAAIDVPD